MENKSFQDWFTVEKIDDNCYSISEYGHWEETHCYLINGSERSLIIDTGLGIGNIYNEVRRLTDNSVIAAATHIHWDHIGGHRFFSEFYVHEKEVDWVNGKFPLSIDSVKGMLTEQCILPHVFDINKYKLFQGFPAKILTDNDVIDLGDRQIFVLHTPGHSPGSMCFFEQQNGYLFVGDLVYKGMLFANYPSTDPNAYLQSLEKISTLEVSRLFPGHHTLNIKPDMIVQVRNGLRQIDSNGQLRHGAGVFDFGEWSIVL